MFIEEKLAWCESNELEQDARHFMQQLYDYQWVATLFLQTREQNTMREKKKNAARGKKRGEGIVLPAARRKPVDNPWQYAYLLTGEKKIGKTTFAIEGCEELVLQFDKPQLAYEIREEVIKSWKHFERMLKALEARAEKGDFPYERIVVDGVAESYAMCQVNTCLHFGVDHPSEEGYARGWHHLRDTYTSAVNRLLRLQLSANCGVIFISHAEWKEKSVRGGGKMEKLVPDMPPTCEEIVNGKVDGWFVYDYDGKDRVLVVRGDQTVGAGHRIDGHFLTPEKERVREIPMGNSPKEALENFMKAFNNEQELCTIEEYKAIEREKRTKKKLTTKREGGVRRKRK